MREILFRGKEIDNNEWVKGAFIAIQTDLDENDQYFIVDDINFRDSIYDVWKYAYEVDHKTVGQFTGKVDKNGKKIFEGDIVRVCLDPEICVGDVIWDKEIASYNILFNNGKCVLPLDIFIAKNKVGDKVWIEVIGNIHDNPELLGGAEDGN